MYEANGYFLSSRQYVRVGRHHHDDAPGTFRPVKIQWIRHRRREISSSLFEYLKIYFRFRQIQLDFQPVRLSHCHDYVSRFKKAEVNEAYRERAPFGGLVAWRVVQGDWKGLPQC